MELERFRCANQEYVERNRRLIQLQGLFYPSLAFFLGLGAWLVLWLGSRQVILGRITVGEFVAFNAYLVMLSWPMIAFGWVTNILQRGMASWQRMLEVFDVEPSVRDASAPAALRQPEEVRGRVEFRNLSFAYNGRPVLDRVSVTIEPGQTLAIVGATGSGKSTLVSLLPRLYDPPPGTVFIDGLDVRQIPLAVLRGAIGYVSQEPLLFSDTSREMSRLGRARNRRPHRARRIWSNVRWPSRGSTRTWLSFRAAPTPSWRARDHALRGAEAARRAGPRADGRPAHPHSG